VVQSVAIGELEAESGERALASRCERDSHDLHLRVDERVFEDPAVMLIRKPERFVVSGSRVEESFGRSGVAGCIVGLTIRRNRSTGPERAGRPEDLRERFERGDGDVQ